MKKFFALFICIFVLLLQISCGKNQEKTTVNSTDSEKNSVLTTSLTESIVTANTTTTTIQDLNNTEKETDIEGISGKDNLCKHFSSLQDYINEFMKYKSFEDINKSVGYIGEYDKYIRKNTSLILQDKYFMTMEYPNTSLYGITYYFNGMYVSFAYKNSDVECLMGYDTSRENIDYYKVNLQKNYDVAFTTDDGCSVYRTKQNSYFYQWYDKEFDCIFFIQSESIKNNSDAKEIIEDIKINKIKIV